MNLDFLTKIDVITK